MRTVLSTLVLTNIGPGLVIYGDAIFALVAFDLIWVLRRRAAYARKRAGANFRRRLLCCVVICGALAPRAGAGLAAALSSSLLVYISLVFCRCTTLGKSLKSVRWPLCLLSGTMLFYSIRLMDADGMRGVLMYVPAGHVIRKIALLRA